MVICDRLLWKCVTSWVSWRESVLLAKGTNLPVSLQKCAEIIVAHLGYLNYTQYTVTVGFENLDLPSIKEMNFTVSIPADLTCLTAHLFSSHSSVEGGK